MKPFQFAKKEEDHILDELDEEVKDSLHRLEPLFALSPGEGRRFRIAPKVLLVDDNPMFGTLMTKASRQMNISLQYFPSVESLHKISLWDFDLLILDYDLGNISGLQLGKFLSRLDRQVPIVLISEYKGILRHDAISAEFKFINKSEGLHVILRAVIDACAKHWECPGWKKS